MRLVGREPHSENPNAEVLTFECGECGQVSTVTAINRPPQLAASAALSRLGGHAMARLILKRASASRRGGEWNEDVFDVLEDGAVVGRIFKANAAPVGTPCMWTLFGLHNDRTIGFRFVRVLAVRALAVRPRKASIMS
jgi:hypothetical protein